MYRRNMSGKLKKVVLFLKISTLYINNEFHHAALKLIPRDAPVGHRRGNNPVEYVFFIFVTRSHKKQCQILIEV